MTAGDLVLVVACVLVALTFAGVVVALLAVRRTLVELDATLAQVRAEVVPLVAELRGAVHGARADLDRFDRVLGSAEAISGAVEGASRVASTALAAPVIKTVALASGTSRAARRLRRRA